MTASHKKLLSVHEVENVVVACIDFRFRHALHEAIKEAFGIDHYDEIKLAGGAKNCSLPGVEAPASAKATADKRREVVRDDVALALEKHRAQRIILLNHENCGKYAAEGYTFGNFPDEKAFHCKELMAAGAWAKKHFPKAEVRLGFVYVTEDEKVKIEEVKGKK